MELQNHNILSCKSTHTSTTLTHSEDEPQINDFCSADPFVLSFINLSYSVNIRRPKMVLPFCRNKDRDDHENIGITKLLLKDISGQAREGEIMAVVGASGSGKSTLIDALAGRIEKESLKGSVTLNGQVLESRVLKTISAYVMQDDLLFPMLTVEETLMFSAEFRLPRSISKQKKRATVQALIDQLGLQSVANTVIGDEGHRGVSGGERRRVSIGVDIIHDPILVFLDEPTSGLDSTSAFMVVKVLQRIAKSGSIVIMSVHQPSNRIMSLLDNLIFLSRGQTIYSGKPTSLLQFFEEFGHPIPKNENPTEFALDLIRELEESSDRITNLVEFNESWVQHTMKNPHKLCDKPSIALEDAIKASISKGKLVTAGNTTTRSDSNSNSISSVPSFVNPFWTETIVIAKRLLTNSRRMPQLFGIRLVATLVTGFILSTFYWQLDDSPKGVKRRFDFLVFTLMNVFLNCLEEIPVFIQERYIFMREAAYNTYRHSSYVLAHSIVSVPSFIVLSFTLAVTNFWAVGLSGGLSGFFFFFVTIFASFWAGSSLMTFISGLVSHQMSALCIGACTIMFFLACSGFIFSRHEISPYWIWLHYISLIKYPYQGLLINEYGDPAKCFSRGVQLFDSTTFVDLSESMKIKMLESMSSVLGSNFTSSRCFVNGPKILELRGMTDISKWHCLWFTIAWGFFFRVLFYLTLLFGSKNKRI
ncbi:hypothetical protein Dsin_007585 [Dipteronia sinensis]|uniref:ABC transporter domain-containing protein n=1 Tax=Dipteronia sinensis TaxID=43782 RepID=A0AAE0EGL4_9ROSI|nr:hypothetical protein Dsin_007585 [Dipteronia sinensis]